MSGGRLELVLTVRRPPGEAFVYRFDADEVTIGRGEGATVRLPEPSVSAVHVRIRRTELGFIAVDPGSRHGTRVGGELLEVGRARPLRDGDALEVGPFLVEVFLDRGGGLTTDDRDTGRLEQALAQELALDTGSGWWAWVLRGGAAGQVEPLAADRVVDLGSAPTSAIALPDPGVAPRHAELRLVSGGVRLRVLAPGLQVRGQAAEQGVELELIAGDVLRIGDALVQLKGPPSAERVGQARPWSAFEKAALSTIVLALGGLGWLLLR